MTDDRDALARRPREALAAPAEPDRLRTALPLTQAQREVVRTARTAAISVVSGAPGNGKTHAAVAAAVHAVARGESVLVATKTTYAAEVIADFLERTPGPTPIVFGSAERREALARELAEGTATQAGVDLDRRAEELGRVEERLRVVYAAIAERLELERSAVGADDALVGRYRAEVPRAFDRDLDLDATARLLHEAKVPTRGWWSRRRNRRLHRQLRQRLGVDESVATETLDAALDLARSERAALRLAAVPADGPFGGRDPWAELDRVDEEARETMGRLLADTARARRNHGDARRAVAGLGRALRAGRGTRRSMLADLDARDLLAALPLWVGSLADIDDLLPAAAGLFDLVILDEASQIDQVQWAVALLRARRALVVGDPQQLRHLSFVGDDDVRAALAAHQLESLAGRLDLRRVSAFDAAAAVAPVQWLDEHHRSVPHLIEFSARRFYPRPVYLATRHPRNECIDAIELRWVDGTRLKDGTNPAEVERIGEELAALLEAGATSVGVVTPIRAQADALEQHVLARFPWRRSSSSTCGWRPSMASKGTSAMWCSSRSRSAPTTSLPAGDSSRTRTSST